MLPACGAVIAPSSATVTKLFCTNFPVVESNRVMALSVLDAGPVTSPRAAPLDAAVILP